MHINASGQQVSGNQYSARARVELPHDYISFLLIHISMHGRHGEVLGIHLCAPINLSLSVDEDDCLGDDEGFIQVTQCVQLPLLSFHIDVELVNTLQSQLLLFDENPNRIPHELLCHLKHIGKHCS